MNKKSMQFFALLFFFGLTVAIYADTPLSYNLRRMSLDELLNAPIDVTSLTSQRPSESAAVALVVTEEIIQQRGYSTLIDLMEDIPQIEIAHRADSGRATEISILGLHDTQRFQVLIDGVRVTPYTGNLYPLCKQFSLANAKQVEFIFGPVSSLYGADAFSGVINIVTKSGEEVDGAVITSGVGSFATVENSFVVGEKFVGRSTTRSSFLDNGSLVITAHKTHTEGPFLPKYYPEDFSWYNNQFQSGNMSLFGTTVSVPFRKFDSDEDSAFLHARIDLKRFEFGLIRMAESHSSSMGVRPDVSLYSRDAVFHTKYLTLYGKYNHHSADKRWKFKTLFSNQVFEVDPRTKFLNQYSGYRDAYKYAKDTSTSFEERVTYDMAENKKLLMGLTYQKHSSLPRTQDLAWPFDAGTIAENQGYVYPGSTLSAVNPQGIPQQFFHVDYHNLGAYMQLELKNSERFRTTLGIRYDSNSIYGDSINPRIGFVWKPKEKQTYKLMYGEAFLAPSPDKTYQHYGSFVPDATTASGLMSFFLQIPNPDLEPERIRSVQAEYTHKFSDNVWATLSAYQNWVFDLQQTETIGAGTYLGVPVATLGTWTNQGSSKNFGGTIRLDGKTYRGPLSIGYYLAYTYSDGDINGNFLPYNAMRSMRAGLDFKRGQWSISPRVRYQSKSYNMARDANGNMQGSDPFAIVNMYIKCRDILRGSNKVSLYLQIENLFDQRYYNPARADSAGFGASPQCPRVIKGGAILEF